MWDIFNDDFFLLIFFIKTYVVDTHLDCLLSKACVVGPNLNHLDLKSQTVQTLTKVLLCPWPTLCAQVYLS